MAEDLRPTVVLSEHLDVDAARWLAERTKLWVAKHDTDEFDKVIGEAEGLVIRTYTQINDALFDKASKLKVIGRAGVGLDNVDLEGCRQRGIRVVYTPDANTQAVVEYVFELILRHVRPVFLYQQPITAEEFHQHRRNCIGGQLSEMTLGLLGMGRIGRRMADVAEAIGMRVLYHDLLTPGELQLPPGQGGAPVGLDELCRESDILSIHIDGRSSNQHFVNEKLLSMLKPTCLLINAARGMLVDNAALAKWADSVKNKGGFVILDVHDPEPPREDYPLYNLANVALAPHLASRTPAALHNMSWVVRDVVRVLKGEEPKYPAI